DVERQIATGDELPEDRPPFVLALAGAAAVTGEPVMPEFGDTRGLPSAQHVDEMRRSEALAGRLDRRNRKPRSAAAIDRLGRVLADVAIAAGFAMLAEIGKQ